MLGSDRRPGDGTGLAREQGQDGRHLVMTPDSSALSVKLLGDLTWHLEKVARAASRLEERLDALAWKTRRAVAESGVTQRGCQPCRPKPTHTWHTPDVGPVVWIARLKTEQRPDGSLIVFVNNRRPFALQPHLGALLLALAEDTGVSDDEGVGFKTVGDLAIRMSKRLGTPRLSGDTVNKYVCKLRKELCRRAGLEADVIQTNRRLGRRLAVRRSMQAGS